VTAGSAAVTAVAARSATTRAATAPPSASGGRRVITREAIGQVGTIRLPAPFAQPASFDISWFDRGTQTYYLSDRTNGGVDAINARTNTVEGVIGRGFFAGAGADASDSQKATCGTDGIQGPNGNLVVRIGGVSQLWASDGVTASAPVSSVKVFDLAHHDIGKPATTVSTGGVCRADELSYDPTNRLVMVANDLDSPPYVSFISVNRDPSKDGVVATIRFGTAIDGLEQSVWDPRRHLVYLNVPQVPAKDGAWVGEVAAISPRSRAVVQTFRTPGCSPAGMALDAQADELLLGCSGDALTGDSVHGVNYHPNPGFTEVVDARSGHIVTRIDQVSGSDEVWFDPIAHRYYAAADAMTSNGKSTGYSTPVLGVIGAGAAGWLGNCPTSGDAHSVAADPVNGHVFVPIPGYGIAVFADGSIHR
jgi:hypothetical protein